MNHVALWKSLLLACCLLLSSCSSIEVGHYRNEKPELDLPAFFSQPVKAWGMFQKRSGEVVKRFTVTIEGRKQGEQLILDEHFVYSDGTLQRRVWTLTPDGPGRWKGTAGDVIGEAIGEVAGNALRWRYTLNLEVDGKFYPVQFDDWMYLMDEDTLINRSFMSKFGVELGQVTLFFRRGADNH
ncbi:lipoprotein [Pseudomonas cichorii]|nr:lipoprotein [Pseudomonas cichorii]